MSKYLVTHEDGRQTAVFAENETGAKRQANHQETTRAVIAMARGLPNLYTPSIAVSVVCIKTDMPARRRRSYDLDDDTADAVSDGLP